MMKLARTFVYSVCKGRLTILFESMCFANIEQLESYHAGMEPLLLALGLRNLEVHWDYVVEGEQ